ncbi:CDP-glycerol glycerophosphotransferase family protein [Lacisediminihabitans changchengi]|uniref:CDP-glycerol glycerophosphotransferase family protein n=1 Tax=Lacisediminihabitans changchengi TaxID=2787634 RepID=A0A934SQR2_9MICO|nr:CDP-glycerol glycerophosphotransferase family protein [Lacisediminihabitans changchengi]MBK4346439.1 CDP-glycerol glycerophosphotransferase family protein [Lacisediminihabitans changchengi]
MPRLLDRFVAFAILVVPPSTIIAIHGFGDDEENALRIAHSALDASTPKSRVVLLSKNPDDSRALYRIANRQNKPLDREPRFVSKNTIRGLWIFLRARVVFYTHGLFGSPRSGRRRIHVLLGHGHGPKSAKPNGAQFHYLADLASTNSSTWGLQVIRDLGITAEDAAVVTGNPREDAFDESADRSRLSALGIDPGRPVVVWLPTYRVSDHAAFGGWVDGERLDTMDEYRRSMAELKTLCAQHDITLVTKSHVLDAQGVSDEWEISSITNESLRSAGLSFYQFLQLSDGLVSDFSSVWVDYLSSGKSIGLLIHDVDAYAEARGLNTPSIRTVAAELELSDSSRLERFVESIANGAIWKSEALAAVKESIEFPKVDHRSDAVIDSVIFYAGAHSVSVPLTLR